MAWSKESASSRGYGSAWRKLRNRIMKRDNELCQVCIKRNRLTKAREVDHILSKADGGTDDESNLQAICRGCHEKKTITDKGYKVKPQFGLDGWPVDD